MTAIAPRPKRRFGQNFLVNAGVIETLLRVFGPRPGDLVLEVGPGRGALTRRLAGRVARLLAVEIDARLADPLRADLAAAVQGGTLDILNADILMLDLAAAFRGMGAGGGRRVRVIANLPYNVAAAVILRLLALPDLVEDLLVMVQREVAARILSPPGRRTYGALSVLCQAQSRVESVLRVRPGSFRPIPKVESEVLRLTPIPGTGPPAGLEEVLRAAFGQRRKTLLNNLARLDNLGEAGARGLIREAGLEPGMRPEQVPVAGFLALARARGAIIRR